MDYSIIHIIRQLSDKKTNLKLKIKAKGVIAIGIQYEFMQGGIVMAARTNYQIVGRYMDGSEVTGYHLMDISTGKNRRYSREQLAFLVGKGQVTNCSGQIYQDKLLLRGVGMSLDDLPVHQEGKGMTRTDSVGKIRRGTTAADAMTQLMIVGLIKNGRETVGYVVQNSGGATKRAKRSDVIQLASDGRIGNARVQNYNGRVLLRGVGVNLDELPVENIGAVKAE